MKNSTRYLALLGAMASLLLAACAALNTGSGLPRTHPEPMERGQQCTECHETYEDSVVYERYNHDTFFGETHGPVASRGERVCAMCHAQSYCNDCHAGRVELKPSIKEQTSTWRRMPHRGDYLSRHRIDARLDPASCYRCHGNPKSAATCVRCHG